MKRATLRPLAEQDLVDAVQFYVKAGDHALGERFFDAALAALKPIERMPAMGSPRLGKLCEIPRLRTSRITGFPAQWFYFEAEDHLDVVRLLGERQDVVAILGANLEQPCVEQVAR
ncbi:type II toxin-antitoxin system RelE/ParE family toxin [Variovorax sp. KK3]|uniref:type II toxin-antitoxin system RelE/ParE family toxin n=1 Tax=Variovorax sp. KK3 TaxID=1855728 RepID=UPI00097CBF75|nr:type II toxin-antitoxin system RelE/ParE family toxin [Variovorax sp. KK3]